MKLLMATSHRHDVFFVDGQHTGMDNSSSREKGSRGAAAAGEQGSSTEGAAQREQPGDREAEESVCLL